MINMRRSITIKKDDTTILRITVSGENPAVIQAAVKQINETIFKFVGLGDIVRDEFNPKNPTR